MARKFLLCTLSISFGCFVSVLLVELVLRVSNVWIGRHSDTMFTVMDYDAVLGWKMKPNISGTIDMVDVEGIPVRSNSLGFWDRDFPIQKTSGRSRILFLGDSFTWGLGVRESERFTNVLAAANPQWEILNFGVPGYGTDQSLLVWQHLALRYQPDVVVLTVYENDYGDNVSSVRSGRRKPYFELKEGDRIEVRNIPVNARDFWDDGIFNQIAPSYAALFPEAVQKRSRIVHWLAKNSDLARLVYTVLRSGSAHAAGNEHSSTVTQGGKIGSDGTKSTESELNPRQQVQVRLLGAIIEELAKQVKTVNARFALVLAGRPSAMYEGQKKLFDRVGILSLDATTESLASSLPGGTRVYYPYSKHWTPEANRAVADLLSKFIQERILCDHCR